MAESSFSLPFFSPSTVSVIWANVYHLNKKENNTRPNLARIRSDLAMVYSVCIKSESGTASALRFIFVDHRMVSSFSFSHHLFYDFLSFIIIIFFVVFFFFILSPLVDHFLLGDFKISLYTLYDWYYLCINISHTKQNTNLNQIKHEKESNFFVCILSAFSYTNTNT